MQFYKVPFKIISLKTNFFRQLQKLTDLLLFWFFYLSYKNNKVFVTIRKFFDNLYIKIHVLNFGSKHTSLALKKPVFVFERYFIKKEKKNLRQ